MDNMKYKGIIFDLDGVICHTDKYHYLAWKHVADKLGIYFDEKINDRLRGISRAESFEIVLENFSGELSEEEKLLHCDEKNTLYRELLVNMTPADLSCEVKDTLKQLKSRGLKLAIGSSSKNAAFVLNRIGLGEFFHAISDGSIITRPKPDPEVFLVASQMINEEPTHCLVVEDAVAGVEAALVAGMDCAAVGDAVKCRLATYNLRGFAELLEVI